MSRGNRLWNVDIDLVAVIALPADLVSVEHAMPDDLFDSHAERSHEAVRTRGINWPLGHGNGHLAQHDHHAQQVSQQQGSAGASMPAKPGGFGTAPLL